MSTARQRIVDTMNRTRYLVLTAVDVVRPIVMTVTELVSVQLNFIAKVTGDMNPTQAMIVPIVMAEDG